MFDEIETQIQNRFINEYLTHLKDATEAPPLFHVWAAISAAGACAQRRTWFDMGMIRIYFNQYIILVGPSGVRKSTALSISRRLISSGTHKVQFAPSDTAGHRQGLIKSMADEIEDDEEFNTIEKLAELNLDSIDVSDKQPRSTYICAGELATFIGQKSFEFISFLTDIWDNLPAYSYRLNSGKFIIYKPSVSMLAATTAESMFACLPNNTIEGGFLSRTILVYCAHKHKAIPWPETPDPKRQAKFSEIYNYIAESVEGPMTFKPDAKQRIIELYSYEPEITDTRFSNYKERRNVNLVKTACSLALLEKRMTLQVKDINDAHLILSYTEKFMSEALGEYGMNPITVAKQRIVDYLTSAKLKQPMVSTLDLYTLLNRDITKNDFTTALSLLCQDGKLVKSKIRHPNSNTKYEAYALVSRLSAAEKSKYIKTTEQKNEDLQDLLKNGGR
jgi:hypothetical protein